MYGKSAWFLKLVHQDHSDNTRNGYVVGFWCMSVAIMPSESFDFKPLNKWGLSAFTSLLTVMSVSSPTIQ